MPLTDSAIEQKYLKYKSIDPFPDIPGTLLNSADITSYVNATGMVDPFYEKDLKSASYAARISGVCKYWDSETKVFRTIQLEKTGDKLVLEPNAIAFVGIEPTFRLPDYIALRFNLKITHVYRGLLLGTGPLIDPGYEGKIYIPLHNLTSNEYVFSYKEQLIWIEFTKTSELPRAARVSENEKKELEQIRSKEYKAFPKEKTHKELNYFLGKALDGTNKSSVVSSVPAAVNQALDLANNARKAAEEATDKLSHVKKVITISAIGGGLAIVIALAALLFSSWDVQNDYYSEAISQIRSVERESLENSKQLNKNFEKYILELENKNRAQDNLINALMYKNTEQEKAIAELKMTIHENGK